MNIHAPRGHQRSLANQQENPAGKCRSVHMNDQTGQRRVKHSGEIVRARKSHENSYQHQQGHGGEEYMVVTAAWQTDGRLCGTTWMSYGGRHRSSLIEQFDRVFLEPRKLEWSL